MLYRKPWRSSRRARDEGREGRRAGRRSQHHRAAKGRRSNHADWHDVSRQARLPGPGCGDLTPPIFRRTPDPWVGDRHALRAEEARTVPSHPPPPLSSRRWVDQFNEISYGRDVASARTPEQTAIARFWTANVIRRTTARP